MSSSSSPSIEGLLLGSSSPAVYVQAVAVQHLNNAQAITIETSFVFMAVVLQAHHVGDDSCAQCKRVTYLRAST
jgi:uncharacterized MAPEG superfamily protein